MLDTGRSGSSLNKVVLRSRTKLNELDVSANFSKWTFEVFLEHLVHRSLSAKDLETFKPLQHDLNFETLSILSTNLQLKITLYSIISSKLGSIAQYRSFEWSHSKILSRHKLKI